MAAARPIKKRATHLFPLASISPALPPVFIVARKVSYSFFLDPGEMTTLFF